MAERDYLKTEAVFLTEKTPKKEVVVTPPLREDSLTVTKNGTYQAPIGRGYTDVEVNVQELPEVTSEDNGDVLTVVEGEWAKATPASELPSVTSSNNGEVLGVVGGEWAATKAVKFVNLTPTSATTATADKTNGEIYALINVGVAVKIEITLGSYRYTADVNATAENVNPEDDSFEMTNLIALLPNIPNSAFYIISTGDQSANNTEWTLTVVPFAS